MAVGLTPSQQLAAVTSSGFYSLWNLFSGFLIPKASMPSWWVWYYWICPVAWTLYGLITSQLGNVQTPFYAAGFGAQIAVKDFITSYLGYKYDWLGNVVAVCFGFMAVFWLVFAFSIKYLNFQTRWISRNILGKDIVTRFLLMVLFSSIEDVYMLDINWRHSADWI